jgi:thiol-disulfide isomerase/thioredoxin
MKRFTHLFENLRATMMFACLMLTTLSVNAVDLEESAYVDSYLGNAEAVYAEPGKPFEFYITLSNLGDAAIESFTYGVELEGMETQSNSVTLLQPLASGVIRYIGIKAIAPESANGTTMDGQVRITSINGNDISMKSATFSLTLKSFAPKKRSLVEDYTGTWCGYCPRGWVAMEEISRDFPGEMLKIAYHFGDPMDVPTSMDPIEVTGYPTMQMNRTSYYAYYIPYFAIEAMNTPAEAEVEVTDAAWSDETYSTATCQASIRFNQDIASGEYKVELALIEDSLKDITGGWYQTTYYSEYDSGEWDDPLWDIFTSVNSQLLDGYYVPELTFNDVCLANTLADEQFDAYLPAAAAGEEILVQYTFAQVDSIRGYYDDLLLRHPGLCRIAVIVTRTDDGSFVNCAWLDMEGAANMPSGLQMVTPDAETASTEVYTLSGMRVNSRDLAPGIYIVRRGGAVRKIQIK